VLPSLGVVLLPNIIFLKNYEVFFKRKRKKTEFSKFVKLMTDYFFWIVYDWGLGADSQDHVSKTFSTKGKMMTK